MFKSGFVAVVGKPNVGKSSLINALVGEKVAIVSPKPQTTRNRILGVLNNKDYQIAFVDTPGEYHAKSKLAEFMGKSIKEATKGVDIILIVLDATKINQTDYEIVESYKNSKAPIIVAINKIDKAKYEDVYPKLAKLNEYKFIKDFVSVSAKDKKNLDEITSKILDNLNEGEPLFDSETFTDKSVRFMASEIIREKVLLFVQEEIPHFVGVEILTFNEDKNKVKICADIICEKDSHKQIIIGKGGAMIKKIGTYARKDIEQLVQKKVFLELFVKTREGWQEDRQTLNNLGYADSDI